MENIKIALVCGLCAGCKHAIRLANDASRNNKVVLFKEIVHNKNINNSFKLKGVECVDDLQDLDSNFIAILRAHGEPPETYQYLNKNKINFLDGTCKNVKAIHDDVEKYSNAGYKIVIIGKYGKLNGKVHPEIYGTIGYCKDNPILIEDNEDVEKLKNINNEKLLVVCQTTFNPEKFEVIKNAIFDILHDKNNEILVKNTICGAQMAIQNSSLLLANQSDVMIVVGGKNSSNSIELFNNIRKIRPSIFIENINDWKSEFNKINFKINKETKIGITAGASTDRRELEELKIKIERFLNVI